MKINFLTIIIIIYAFFTEHMISILSFNIRISHLLAAFFVFWNFNKYIITNFKFNHKTIIAYLLIILVIIINDLIVGVKLIYTANSIFFFLMSLVLYFFFFNIFLRNENNFAKLFIISFISLIIYKNGQLIFFPRDTLASTEAICGSKYAGPFLFFTLGFSYFLILKNKKIIFLFLTSAYLFLSFYFLSHSNIFIMTSTLILYYSIIILRIRISYFKLIFFAFFFVLFIDIFFLQIIFSDLLAFLFTKRTDSFLFIPNILENFPLGIGSKAVLDNNSFRILELEEYFNLEIQKKNMGFISDENSTSTHSMIMHMLLKNGFFSIIPFLYLFYIMAITIFKIFDHEKINNGLKFFSTYIFAFFTYALMFNGIGSILIEFPIYFGFIMSVKKNYEL